MEFPRECERRFLCTLSGRSGSLLSRSGLTYRIWSRNISHISYDGGLVPEPMDSTYTLPARLELLFMGPVVLVWDKR